MKPRLNGVIERARSLTRGRERVLRSGLWSLLLRLSGLASGFAIGVLLARMLGPVQFGIYGLATTIAAVGMTVAQLGTPQLAVRELSVRKARDDWAGVRTIVREFGAATTLAALAIGLAALAGSFAIGSSTSDRMLIVEAAALTILTTWTGLLAAELRGLGALLKGQAMDIAVRPAVALVIIAGMLAVGLRMDALLALTVQNFVALGAAIVSWLWLWRVIPKRARAGRAGRNVPWLRTALPLGAVDVLRQFDGSYGLVLVAWLSTGLELGVFRVAVACMVLAAMPVTIFHILLAPTLSRLHASGEKEEMQRLLSWTAAAMTAIMVPVAVGAWFFGKPAITLVFGAAYAGAWLPLFVLTLAQLTYALFGMGPILLAMCDGERDLIRIYAIAIAGGVLLAVPATIAWGGTGAALGPLVSALVIGLMARRYARRELGVEITAIGFSRA